MNFFAWRNDINYAGRTVEREVVEAVIKQHSCPLPADYVDFVSSIGGADVEELGLSFSYGEEDAPHSERVTDILAFGESRHSADLPGYWLSDWDYGSKLFPVAWTENGFLALGLTEAIHGKVFYIHCDDGPESSAIEPDSSDEEILQDPGSYAVAQCFERFWNNLIADGRTAKLNDLLGTTDFYEGISKLQGLKSTEGSDSGDRS